VDGVPEEEAVQTREITLPVNEDLVRQEIELLSRERYLMQKEIELLRQETELMRAFPRYSLSTISQMILNIKNVNDLLVSEYVGSSDDFERWKLRLTY